MGIHGRDLWLLLHHILGQRICNAEPVCALLEHHCVSLQPVYAPQLLQTDGHLIEKIQPAAPPGMAFLKTVIILQQDFLFLPENRTFKINELPARVGIKKCMDLILALDGKIGPGKQVIIAVVSWGRRAKQHQLRMDLTVSAPVSPMSAL